MKFASRFSGLLPLLLLTASAAASDGQSDAAKKPAALRWKTLENAVRDAGTGNKPVLIDVYTDWCGWCKKMDSEVFAAPKISSYLDQKFELVKLNAESNAAINYKDQQTSGAGLARRFGVRGYPTMVFLDSKGDVLTVVPGYINAEQFLPIVMFLAERAYETMKWEEYLAKHNKTNPAAGK